ncbi:hypothetical protein JCM17092_14260 [Haloplanus litoreus]
MKLSFSPLHGSDDRWRRRASGSWPPFSFLRRHLSGMSQTIELADELVERLDEHRAADETREEFIEEFVNSYEQEGRFSDPGL